MAGGETLSEHCDAAVRAGDLVADVGVTLAALAGAAGRIAALIAQGPLAGDLGATVGRNADGDLQKALDLQTHALVISALMDAPVGSVLSEESQDVVQLGDGALAVAVDPLDGSSNIDTNMSVGTIFSIVPNAQRGGALGPFAGDGHKQLAAGFVFYGPQTALVVSFGKGVQIFTLDRRDGTFRLTRPNVRMAQGTREFAINASNYRHWDLPVRSYFDDCISGADGLRGKDFNMRWHGALVAEAFRILMRGGIFLYPADSRKGYGQGRLRLLYEAAPIAFLVEQAGGLASTGRERILDLEADSPHQRVPLIFGAADKVRRLERMHADPDPETSPLFAARGLFRT